MSVWTWLGEQKNQQTLMFIGGGMGAGVAVVVPLLFQFGVLEPKPVAKAVTEPPAVATPRVASAPVATTGGDQSVQGLLDVLARKEKADKVEREYKQQIDAWEFAQKLNTIKGYQVYLSDYPKGHYAHFATAAIDKLRSPIVVAQAEMNVPPVDMTQASAVDVAPPVATPRVRNKRKSERKVVQKTPSVHIAGEPRLFVQCAEGTKLYVDGKERGRITSNLFGSFVVTVPAGKHTVVLVSPQGVLQQSLDLKRGDSLRLTPPFCSANSS